MRRFWIDVRKEGYGVKIEVGKGTEIRGFMSRSWDSIGNNSFPPTHVAFAAWGEKIDYKFCLNKPGKRTPETTTKGRYLTHNFALTDLNMI